MSEKKNDGYGYTREQEAGTTRAPELNYRPAIPKSYRPTIGLIGCGGITEQHLKAYRKYGYTVSALCDIDEGRAIERREEFYPNAAVTTDHREILSDPEIEVVDIATHPAIRLGLVEEALRAGKHVLSQKPFVLDLADGERLADLADANGVKLVVNQNGRWAPHFSYMREAVREGVIGDLTCVDCAVHWDHNWTAGTTFDQIHHLILYDFSIHWFDFVQTLFGETRAEKVYASVARSRGQRAKPPLLAQVIVDYPGAQAVLVFNGNCLHGASDRSMVCGNKGTLISDGPGLMDQTVTLVTESGLASPSLEGQWFPEGMGGTMGELLCAIEEDREPSHSARNNLKSLELCFAALASADSGKPVRVGAVRKLTGS
ncbi:MAG: gfo/Idh/MocA family oxidoreductase [Verrucomicrobia bacterium]|nr:MAG: gfo/Idh/MocA family oxidoreductase [Verrucomicrobiota bacterium]